MAMHRWMTAIASVTVLGVVACGGDSSSDVAQRSDTDGEDTASDAGSASSGDSDAGTEPTTPIELPTIPDDAGATDPVLPNVDPETPIADLDDDDFEKVCDTFVDTTQDLLESVGDLCGLTAMNEALESETETTEEFQEICADARTACEIETKASSDIVSTLECAQSGECQATVEEVDACNAELATLNNRILKPSGSVDIPACDELTPLVATAIQVQVLATLALSGVDVGSEDLGLGDACDTVTEKCPDFALPGDAQPL